MYYFNSVAFKKSEKCFENCVYPGRFVVYIKCKPGQKLMLGNVFKSTFLFSMKYVFRSGFC